MTRSTKTFAASVKTSVETNADGGDAGVVEAVVSVFDTVDHGQDRVLKGAFADTLAAWKASGDPIPFIWSHQWSNPDAHIGVITDAKETDDGLWVKAQVDLDRPFAAQVFHLLKNRRVKEFSFGYETREHTYTKVDGYDYEVRDLVKVDLFEAGPCLLGMNPDTVLLEAAAQPDPTPAPDGGKGVRDTDPTIPDEGRVAALMAKTRYEE